MSSLTKDTDFDRSVLEFCNEISDIFCKSVLPQNFDEKLCKKII